MVDERLESASDLPENCDYPDIGCELSKSCLKCPYPFCVYDMSYDGARLLKEWRNAEIIRLSSAGTTVKELQQIFHLGRAMIFRILKNYREDNDDPVPPAITGRDTACRV